MNCPYLADLMSSFEDATYKYEACKEDISCKTKKLNEINQLQLYKRHHVQLHVIQLSFLFLYKNRLQLHYKQVQYILVQI